MPEEHNERFNILVVDDEPDLEPLINQRMRPEIRRGEYKFTFANNGEEAVEIIAGQDDVDMVVTDINMPKMDGLTLLDQVKQLDPNVHSVVVSAYGDMKNIRTAMNRGAFDFVTKPLDFEDLRTTIERTRAHAAEWRDAIASRDKLMALQNELDTAYDMQQAILPTEFPESEEYGVHGRMAPARNVGGDFFDVASLEGGGIGLTVADVSDKGIPAAMFMMSSRTLLKGSATKASDPGQVLTEVNDMLCKDNKTMMFVTVLYAVYDPLTGALAYANGGHCNPLRVRTDGSCEELAPTSGIVLGLAPEIEYRQERTVLMPGETLIIYSDGVSEAHNPQGEEFGVDRLACLFSKGRAPKKAKEASERVLQAVEDFAAGTPQSDDVTCLTLHRGRGQ